MSDNMICRFFRKVFQVFLSLLDLFILLVQVFMGLLGFMMIVLSGSTRDLFPLYEGLFLISASVLYFLTLLSHAQKKKASGEPLLPPSQSFFIILFIGFFIVGIFCLI